MLCVSSSSLKHKWSVECCHTVKFYGSFFYSFSSSSLPEWEIVIKKFIRIYDANIKLMSISCSDARKRIFLFMLQNIPIFHLSRFIWYKTHCVLKDAKTNIVDTNVYDIVKCHLSFNFTFVKRYGFHLCFNNNRQ